MAAYYQTLSATYEMTGSRLKIDDVLEWACTAEFAPGDRIKLDRDRQMTLHNGVRINNLVTGKPPFFNAGVTKLIYEDSEGSRTIRCRVSWLGGWL